MRWLDRVELKILQAIADVGVLSVIINGYPMASLGFGSERIWLLSHGILIGLAMEVFPADSRVHS